MKTRKFSFKKASLTSLAVLAAAILAVMLCTLVFGGANGADSAVKADVETPLGPPMFITVTVDDAANYDYIGGSWDATNTEYSFTMLSDDHIMLDDGKEENGIIWYAAAGILSIGGSLENVSIAVDGDVTVYANGVLSTDAATMALSVTGNLDLHLSGDFTVEAANYSYPIDVDGAFNLASLAEGIPQSLNVKDISASSITFSNCFINSQNQLSNVTSGSEIDLAIALSVLTLSEGDEVFGVFTKTEAAEKVAHIYSKTAANVSGYLYCDLGESYQFDAALKGYKFSVLDGDGSASNVTVTFDRQAYYGGKSYALGAGTGNAQYSFTIGNASTGNYISSVSASGEQALAVSHTSGRTYSVAQPSGDFSVTIAETVLPTVTLSRDISGGDYNKVTSKTLSYMLPSITDGAYTLYKAFNGGTATAIGGTDASVWSDDALSASGTVDLSTSIDAAGTYAFSVTFSFGGYDYDVKSLSVKYVTVGWDKATPQDVQNLASVDFSSVSYGGATLAQSDSGGLYCAGYNFAMTASASVAIGNVETFTYVWKNGTSDILGSSKNMSLTDVQENVSITCYATHSDVYFVAQARYRLDGNSWTTGNPFTSIIIDDTGENHCYVGEQYEIEFKIGTTKVLYGPTRSLSADDVNLESGIVKKIENVWVCYFDIDFYTLNFAGAYNTSSNNVGFAVKYGESYDYPTELCRGNNSYLTGIYLLGVAGFEVEIEIALDGAGIGEDDLTRDYEYKWAYSSEDGTEAEGTANTFSYTVALSSQKLSNDTLYFSVTEFFVISAKDVVKYYNQGGVLITLDFAKYNYTPLFVKAQESDEYIAPLSGEGAPTTHLTFRLSNGGYKLYVGGGDTKALAYKFLVLNGKVTEKNDTTIALQTATLPSFNLKPILIGLTETNGAANSVITVKYFDADETENAAYLVQGKGILDAIADDYNDILFYIEGSSGNIKITAKGAELDKNEKYTYAVNGANVDGITVSADNSTLDIYLPNLDKIDKTSIVPAFTVNLEGFKAELDVVLASDNESADFSDKAFSIWLYVEGTGYVQQLSNSDLSEYTVRDGNTAKVTVYLLKGEYKLMVVSTSGMSINLFFEVEADGDVVLGESFIQGTATIGEYKYTFSSTYFNQADIYRYAVLDVDGNPIDLIAPIASEVTVKTGYALDGYAFAVKTPGDGGADDVLYPYTYAAKAAGTEITVTEKEGFDPHVTVHHGTSYVTAAKPIINFSGSYDISGDAASGTVKFAEKAGQEKTLSNCGLYINDYGSGYGLYGTPTGDYGTFDFVIVVTGANGATAEVTISVTIVSNTSITWTVGGSTNSSNFAYTATQQTVGASIKNIAGDTFNFSGVLVYSLETLLSAGFDGFTGTTLSQMKAYLNGLSFADLKVALADVEDIYTESRKAEQTSYLYRYLQGKGRVLFAGEYIAFIDYESSDVGYDNYEFSNYLFAFTLQKANASITWANVASAGTTEYTYDDTKTITAKIYVNHATYTSSYTVELLVSYYDDNAYHENGDSRDGLTAIDFKQVGSYIMFADFKQSDDLDYQIVAANYSLNDISRVAKITQKALALAWYQAAQYDYYGIAYVIRDNDRPKLWYTDADNKVWELSFNVKVVKAGDSIDAEAVELKEIGSYTLYAIWDDNEQHKAYIEKNFKDLELGMKHSVEIIKVTKPGGDGDGDGDGDGKGDDGGKREGSENDLSGGEIAGIVIGSVLGAGLLGVGGYFLFNKGKFKAPTSSERKKARKERKRRDADE